jgi:hypothetical protein
VPASEDAIEHQDREGEKMQTFERLGQPLVVPRQTTKALRPSETSLHHHLGNSTNSFFASGSFTTSSWIPCFAAASRAFSKVINRL